MKELCVCTQGNTYDVTGQTMESFPSASVDPHDGPWTLEMEVDTVPNPISSNTVDVDVKERREYRYYKNIIQPSRM